MLKSRPYVPSKRVAIRADSIDEEISDDVEDEVFIRDGRYVKLSDENGVKRPLMPPRKKNGKKIVSIPIMKKHRRCWKCCEPFCYGLAALTVLIGLIFLAAFILTVFPIPLQKIKVWLKKDPLSSTDSSSFSSYAGDTNTLDNDYVPCTQISVQKVWSKVFPRMNSESSLRRIDLNGDKVDDIVFGYGIDDNIISDVQLPKCQTAQGDREVPCGGGVYAVNGVNGDVLWQKWTISSIFSLYCSVDLDKDGLTDCVAAGQGGIIMAISGNKGSTIWNYRETQIETNSPIITDLYTINSVRDLDGDEVPDILAAHVEERERSKAGHIKLISGKTGAVIRTIPTPFREEVFVPVQIFTEQDGTELLFLLTGGQNTAGGIYTTRLVNLMKYTTEKEFGTIFKRDNSGFMTPAVFTDITGDQFPDIIVSAFNSTIYAFDGRNFSVIWNYTFPASESVSEIVPGHFDHDNITDFMVKYNYGPGYPIYYYSQTTILNGVNGQPLMESMMIDSGGPSSLLGGISISQTNGGDFFLHWQMQCREKFDARDAYEFIPDSDILSQSRADVCMLRYNTSTVVKLYAIARHIEPPGAVIFSSDDIEVSLNRTQLNQEVNSKSALKHPKMAKKIKDSRVNLETESSSIQSLPRRKNGERLEDGYEELKHYLYPSAYAANKIPTEEENSVSKNVEYDNWDDFEERPIHLRGKYPGNRGVRSDILANIELLDNATIETEGATKVQPKLNGNPLNLWDLEIEKEENEAIKEAHEDYNNRDKRESPPSGYLGSISSTGVLLSSLDNAPSSIDYAFILNIRESEVYPPLLLPQDLNCIEEKLGAYNSLSPSDLMTLKKQSIAECLKERMFDTTPVAPKFEPQVVLTRISIGCNCRTLETGEVCSKFNDIDKQKWTSFMGNSGNGLYF